MYVKKLFKKSDGFTLIELLIVIVIIMLLAVVVFAALNPVKRINDAQNARRTADIETMLTAIHEYIVDNHGSLPTGLSLGMAQAQLGTAGTGCAVTTSGCTASGAACVDLTTPLASYLKSIPYDPSSGSATTTRYTVEVDSHGIVTVRSCDAYGITIEISR